MRIIDSTMPIISIQNLTKDFGPVRAVDDLSFDIDEGKVVVSDRFLDSSLAYQGGARGLGIDDVDRVNSFATRGLKPDLTFLLELPVEDAAARGGETDRFKEEGSELQEAVGAAYEALVRADPERWRRIDAHGGESGLDAPLFVGAREGSAD